MLNYMLTPLLTSIFSPGDFSKISTLFALAAFMNVVYTFGMETTYFRFLTQEKEQKVFNTTVTNILLSTVLFSLLSFAFVHPLTNLIKLGGDHEYVQWVIMIVIFDTLSAIPFARLRQMGRPHKYAFLKISNVLLQIGLIYFILKYCKNAEASSLWAGLYDPKIGVGYVILANLFASAFTFILLSAEFRQYRWAIDPTFWKQTIMYSLPLLIVGFGGMINEMIDRFMILSFYPGTHLERHTMNGIYSANYKLAIVIAIFIQAFRLGAEPFFFRESTNANAPQIYARIMKFFVVTCCFCFLGVVLFLDLWKYFMGDTYKEYWSGLVVVPLLMVAKIFLGIYYNLSVWYKLTNKNIIGAWITIGGAVITVASNYILIPYLGYTGCAITTIICYGSMMLSSYYLGQKHFPVPYDVKRILTYILSAVLTYGIYHLMVRGMTAIPIKLVIGFVLCIAYATIVFISDKEEFSRLPILSKWLTR
jgi:O-antigen/teichoic acid export membrane protein